jgi:hypothetical protein
MSQNMAVQTFRSNCEEWTSLARFLTMMRDGLQQSYEIWDSNLDPIDQKTGALEILSE